MAYEIEWVIARHGTVRHARLTKIDKRTARALDASTEDFAGGPYNQPLGPGVLACEAIRAHPVPTQLRPVNAASQTKACDLCQEVIGELNQL